MLSVIARPEAEAIQPLIRNLPLDCFAVLAMTVNNGFPIKLSSIWHFPAQVLLNIVSKTQIAPGVSDKGTEVLRLWRRDRTEEVAE